MNGKRSKKAYSKKSAAKWPLEFALSRKKFPHSLAHQRRLQPVSLYLLSKSNGEDEVEKGARDTGFFTVYRPFHIHSGTP
jgi:hypothetical protein